MSSFLGDKIAKEIKKAQGVSKKRDKEVTSSTTTPDYTNSKNSKDPMMSGRIKRDKKEK